MREKQTTVALKGNAGVLTLLGKHELGQSTTSAPADDNWPEPELEPRWVELRPHTEQIRLWHDQTRFKLVPSGRRSGKTELAKRRLVEHLFRRTWHGRAGAIFRGGADARSGQANLLGRSEGAGLRGLDRSVSETHLQIVTPTRGAALGCAAWKCRSAIEGGPWDGCVIDELANCKPKLWDAHVRPALADRRGWAWLIGVPDMDSPGQVELRKAGDPGAQRGRGGMEVFQLAVGRHFAAG